MSAARDGQAAVPPAARITGALRSPWTRTVVMTCIEKQIDHELVQFAYGGPEHERAHPFVKIPVVDVGGLRLIETLAITTHLDETNPDPPLLPDRPEDRARVRTWMSVCADYLFRDVVRLIPRDRPRTADETATATTALRRAERLVGGSPFLVGDAVTLADLYLAPQIANCHEKAPELLADVPGISRWFAAIRERPSFVRSAPPRR